jgi:multicomponent Na+:H+ antiporter subunit E
MDILMTRNRWLDTVSSGGIFLVLWWLLTDGAVSSWWIGIPAVLLAITMRTALGPPVVLVWSELARFLFFFFRHSLRGGMDVARRAFQRNLSIAPGLYEYTMSLPSGLPQVMMANSVSLLPGTLSVEIEDNVLTVHVLDKHTDYLSELHAVESHIARMLGKPLDDAKEVVIK